MTSIFNYNAHSICAKCQKKVPVTKDAPLFCDGCGADLIAAGVRLKELQKALRKQGKTQINEPLFDLTPYTNSRRRR